MGGKKKDSTGERRDEAMRHILDICQDGVGDPVEMIKAIEIICLANLEREWSENEPED